MIISTGWFKRWFDSDYMSDGPYFSADVMEFIVESKVSLLGSDMPYWDSASEPTGHLLTFSKVTHLCWHQFMAQIKLQKVPESS